MNEQNLIPFTERSESEVRELNSKGGKKSGETRRRKKTMKQQLEMLLALPACDNDKAELDALGIDAEEADNSMVILKGLFLKAASGDVSAVKEIRNILGKDTASAELELKKKELKIKERAREPSTEAINKLDEILKETRENAEIKSETE